MLWGGGQYAESPHAKQVGTLSSRHPSSLVAREPAADNTLLFCKLNSIGIFMVCVR